MEKTIKIVCPTPKPKIKVVYKPSVNKTLYNTMQDTLYTIERFYYDNVRDIEAVAGVSVQLILIIGLAAHIAYSVYHRIKHGKPPRPIPPKKSI